MTRPHRDVDVDFDAAHEDAVLEALADLGYSIETDWRPNRVELSASGRRWVDLHPLVIDDNGDARQAALDGGWHEFSRSWFTTGTLGGVVVPCVSVEAQRLFHSGYELRTIDVLDLAELDRLAARPHRQRLAARPRHGDAGWMDATELRELQSPLKRKYRDDPAAAATPLRAEGDFSAGGITATVSGWAGPVRAGLHPSTGGDGSDACSGDMLLQAVLACAGVTLRSVATMLEVNVRRAELHAVASFDARGTLGVSRDTPVGIQGLVITAHLDTDASEATLVKLGELTERYCVVGQSLAEIPRIVVSRAD